MLSSDNVGLSETLKQGMPELSGPLQKKKNLATSSLDEQLIWWRR